ncbi:hypothetical protein [Pantoea sp. 18069]|uniref:hypothetical protein n=1 Tax=Pantoea sp. 18069 TaxID=2681415 RepID=UPI00135B3D6E|nr:hypothetical protein [Pantoea sp. 18069]
MSIGGITPFNSAAVSQTQLNDTQGTAPLNRQLLKSVLLADQMSGKIASVREQQKQHGLSSSPIDQQLASFWQGRIDTFEEREGVELVQYEHSRDASFLQSKGGQLRAEVEKMPAGPEKDEAKQKLESFLKSNSDKIEARYQQGMARETGSLPARDPFKNVKYITLDQAAPSFAPTGIIQSDLAQLNHLKDLLANSTSIR